MTVLEAPQRRFDSIHIVGTNGKTSTARMTAAILERHGVRTGTYTSPHLVSYRERIQVTERELSGARFAAAVARAAWAAERVNRTLSDDDHVTQFELLTAAALWEMARQEVQVAVVEAGLGGRYDATSVIGSQLVVLTNVGLEHTRWLGSTLRDIAEEKLAVVGDGATLICGADLAPAAGEVAARVAGERRARVLQAEEEDLPKLGAAGAFQRRNFALARAAAQAFLERAGIEARAAGIATAAAATQVPGRMQVVAQEPLTVLDAAHNPHASAALADSLDDLVGGRPLGLVLGVLEDKDAAGMLAILLQRCESAWFTAPPSPRALSPAALQSHARQLGFDAVSCTASPAEALAAAQRWARERAAGVLASGSVYLVGDLLAQLDVGAGAQAGAARAGARDGGS